MIKIKDVVIDTAGNAVAGARVTITAYPGNGAVVLYNADGSAMAHNYVDSDAFGGFSFYISNGHYSRRISKAGSPDVFDEDIYAVSDVAGFTLANGKTLSVNNSLIFNGTDGVTITFPATNATLARTDAGQSFTGTQIMAAADITALTAGTINGTGVSNLNTLNVAGVAALAGTTAASLAVSGNATVGGTLGVTGATTLGTATAASLTTTGAVTVGTDLTVTGAFAPATLAVSGNSTMTGTLGVTGATTLGNAAVGGTLGVTGASTVTTLHATGAVTLDTTLGVTGLTTMTSVNATGNLSVGGTLGVTGNTTVSNLTVTGTLTTSSYSPATLSVSGNGTVGGTFGVTGATTLSSTLAVTGNTTVGGTLGVTGATTVNNLTVNGTFSTAGAYSPASLAVTGTGSFGSTLSVADGTVGTPALNFTTDTGTGIFKPALNVMAFGTNGVEGFRLDSARRILKGTTTVVPLSNGAHPSFQWFGTTDDSSAWVVGAYANDYSSASFTFQKSRGTSVGSTGICVSGDVPGDIFFEGDDGTGMKRAAFIEVLIDGAPAAGSMPGRMSFYTTPSGTTSSIERLRISNAGVISHRGDSGVQTPVINTASHLVLRSYTVATLPTASSYAQALIYVSDGTTNKRLAVSDGTNWRWPDGAIVS